MFQLVGLFSDLLYNQKKHLSLGGILARHFPFSRCFASLPDVHGFADDEGEEDQVQTLREAARQAGDSSLVCCWFTPLQGVLTPLIFFKQSILGAG